MGAGVLRLIIGFFLPLVLTAPAAADPYDDAMALFKAQRFAEAYAQLLPLARSGRGLAQFRVGEMLYDGRGVPQDFAGAEEWFLAAAGQDVVFAAYRLGLMHEFGLGVPKDNAKAVAWFRKAAERGYIHAQYELAAAIAMTRDGYREDQAAKLEWYGKAAAQGHERAQERLAEILERGLDVPADKPKAYLWLTIAAARGSNIAKREKDRLVVDITETERIEAERLARDWRPRVNRFLQ